MRAVKRHNSLRDTATMTYKSTQDGSQSMRTLLMEQETRY